MKPKWFELFGSLTCESQNKLFCYICRKEERRGTLTFSKNAEKAYIRNMDSTIERKGLKSLGHTRIPHREPSMKHNASQKQQPVSQQLSSQLKAEQESRRMCLVKQLQSLPYLLREGLAVRGHKSDEGNLQQLLKLRSLNVPALKQWISERKYFSADVIREQK